MCGYGLETDQLLGRAYEFEVASRTKPAEPLSTLSRVRNLISVLFVLASCGAPAVAPATNDIATVRPDVTQASPTLAPSTSPAASASPTSQPTRSPASTPVRTPELTRVPDARTIAQAFTFKDRDHWVLGYLDGKAGLVLVPESGTPLVSRALPAPLSEITFVDSLRGWATGRIMQVDLLPGCQHAGTTCHDVIASTVDGGRTWKIVRSVYTTGVTGYTFHGLQFVDGLHGWTVQYLDSCSVSCAGELLATEDGGATWTVRSRAKGVFSSFRFIDPLRGWAVETDWWTYYDANGPATRLLATSDGGRTWSQELEGAPVYEIAVLDGTHAWAIARQATCGPSCPANPVQLYRTTDGARWSLVASDLSSRTCVGRYVFAPAFIDATRGVIASGGTELADTGGVLITRDAGETWTCAGSQPAPANAQRGPLPYAGSLLLVTRGNDGSDHVLVSSDAGLSWRERALP